MAVGTKLAAGNQQQIRPFVRPVVDVLIALEKSSISFARLSGDLSARNCSTSSAVGRMPAASRNARRMKSASAHLARWLDVQALHFASTKSSM